MREQTEGVSAQSEAIGGEAATNLEPLRSLVSQWPGAVAVFDRAMRCVALSDRWKSLFAVGDSAAGVSNLAQSPDVADRWKPILSRVFANGTVQAEDGMFERQDGTKQFLRWEVAPWKSDKDGIVGAIVEARGRHRIQTGAARIAGQ